MYTRISEDQLHFGSTFYYKYTSSEVYNGPFTVKLVYKTYQGTQIVGRNSADRVSLLLDDEDEDFGVLQFFKKDTDND